MAERRRTNGHSRLDLAAENGSEGCAGGALRCACGSLLARLVPGGVELKCRRCKRAVIVPLDRHASSGAQ